MLTESEIQNCKKNFLDEIQNCKTIFLGEFRHYSQNDKAEKVFDEQFEKIRSLDFSELHDVDSIFEKFEMSPELASFFTDNLAVDPTLSTEEHFRIGVRLGKEFYRIE